MNAGPIRIGDLELARLLSSLERGDADAGTRLARLWHGAGQGMVVGLSGPPGVGKSVLVGQLLRRAAGAGLRPAVLAVDPSSNLSGGAILGDRMRMHTVGVPPGAFIRSLASRGALGGLAAVVPAAIRAVQAAGCDPVLIETVGVGQNETDIVGVADTVVVVQSPGAGDEIQAMKSGLLEIADIYVLNKVDLAGVPDFRAALADAAAQPRPSGWVPPVVSTSATSGQGVDDLWEAIGRHREWMTATGVLADRRRARLDSELVLAARAELDRRLAALALLERFRAGGVTQQAALAELFAGPAAHRLTATIATGDSDEDQT